MSATDSHSGKLKGKKAKGKKKEKKDKKIKVRQVGKKTKTVLKKFTYANPTAPGEKKDLSGEWPPAYNPSVIEQNWYSWWEKKGFFKADALSDKKNTFTIMIPPPNVTGALHIGHALTNAIQDTLIRWHRMKGDETLWLPGTDHAGIATQVVVEKQLMRDEGKTRHDLGREAFLERTWQWKETYGGRIFEQLRKLGSSFDWEREVFTMDPVRNKAHNEAFIRMFKKGLIYRDKRLVNWDCTLMTAVSDMEVDYIDVDGPTKILVPGHGGRKYTFGLLTSFAYPLHEVEGEIEIATTRLETMLADAAVAVHPEDPRYTHLKGMHVKHPFNGRLIPIIFDSELVDMEFGTGAVKITPGHDPNDYECGKRHGLEMRNLLNDDGTINAEGGKFEGMRRLDCRIALVKALKELGLYRGEEPHKMAIGTCQRSGDIIEPMLKPQWYVNCKDMAARAAQCVRDGELEITPAWHKDTWFRWLDNIRPWCISRQLWWGHRIPAYIFWAKGQEKPTGADASHWVAGHTVEAAMEEAAERLGVPLDRVCVEQDEDVTDTWFSSGLFPFSAFGWPDASPELDRFFPGSVLETGHDILFFWVARMVMMSLELTDKLPFKRVLLHAMVRDAHGEKMSKSKGNVVDPLDVISGISLEELHDKLKGNTNLPPTEIKRALKCQKADYPHGIAECGTDALRFALCAYTSQGKNINLDVNRVVSYRNFCNKLFNATKFAYFFAHVGEEEIFTVDQALMNREQLSIPDKWILSRLQHAIHTCSTALDSFQMSEAAMAVHTWWMELCDTYLEIIKPLVTNRPGEPVDSSPAAQHSRMVLLTCLDQGLRLIHPFMPFVSEELWQRIPKPTPELAAFDSIMMAPFPLDIPANADPHAEAVISSMEPVVHAARALRGQYRLRPSQRPNFYVTAGDTTLLAEAVPLFKILIGAAEVILGGEDMETPKFCGVNVVSASLQMRMELSGMVDPVGELVKLRKTIVKQMEAKERLEKKAASPHFHRMPAHLQEDILRKTEDARSQIESAEALIKQFEEMQ
eukprot:gnl/Dysnectes_brevis/69_a86_4242.p1 GENE.gnl/Dysnectes_brevis/69_a86_4242~~gnl/Dysnectes_brevis/69_a86_4242.p1  ORF type:complete len:1031 (+),score=501.69 gnl/Dysnectes_brevis/69_a86_4242:35-3127(+)